MSDRNTRLATAANLAIAANNLLFVVTFFVVAYNTRFATDDLSFVARSHDAGVLGTVSFFWNHLHGRWAAVGLEAAVAGAHYGRSGASLFIVAVAVFFFAAM